MTRDEALEELKIRLSDGYMLQHSIVSEAIMKQFALYFNDDIDIWAMAGLLHDIDYERTIDNPVLHGAVAADILENLNLDRTIIYSVQAHNDLQELPRNRKMDKVLYLTDFFTDYIIECAYRLPNRKISDVSAEAVYKMVCEGTRSGAWSCNITYMQELGLTAEKFIETAIRAVQEISKEYIYARQRTEI
ncbi:putative nucleotidyltransferase with HDIG domain [Ruminiclostridium sufflavum DSM 19573]|uniref:Putative nucleotidyltransferase with HDIG domain n=1 Tax=Ruminiclostridium sufflavum DSM 19573 TaxID=1121337 RepID=A0A318XLD4_9FIRM|nr:HDIG domain-containing metalloprotein [Ruminiclostridium sufflavum]PYG85904.1 putative nucleotidyltransferase with HDIG domain [Ruminiclostridium sufflavum DSM 19573]